MKLGEMVDDNRTTVLLTDVFYTERESGQTGTMPIVHLCGRDENGERVHIPISHFRPFFFVTEAEFVQKRDAIEREMASANPSVLDYEFGHTVVDQDNVGTVDGVKIVCEVPYDVGRIREEFDETFEADVLFTTRFLTANEIRTYVSVPRHASDATVEDAIHVRDVEPADGDGIDIWPRVCVTDIEVLTGGDGIPDYELANKPVTAITSYDSYADEYWTGVLEWSAWDALDKRDVNDAYEHESTPDNGAIHVYPSEQQLLGAWTEKLLSWQPDVYTGHNSDAFDYPYLVNRCFEQNVYGVRQLSPTEDVYSIEDAPRGTNRQLKGLQCWDAMTAYKKSQIHDLKSYALDYVAEKELGRGKDQLDVSLDDAYKDEPGTFVRYNVRDVEAVWQYIVQAELLQTYRSLSELTGVLFGDAHHNKTLIDSAFLRRAQSYEHEATT